MTRRTPEQMAMDAADAADFATLHAIAAEEHARDVGRNDAGAGLPFRVGRFKDPRLQDHYQRGYAEVAA